MHTSLASCKLASWIDRYIDTSTYQGDIRIKVSSIWRHYGVIHCFVIDGQRQCTSPCWAIKGKKDNISKSSRLKACYVPSLVATLANALFYRAQYMPQFRGVLNSAILDGQSTGFLFWDEPNMVLVDIWCYMMLYAHNIPVYSMYIHNTPTLFL